MLLIFLISLFSSSTSYEILSTGQYCGSTSTYTYSVSSVNVSPWPPTSGSSLTVSMSGSFTKETLVFAMIVDTYYNNQEQKAQFIDIDTDYSQGQTATFNMRTPSGTASGSYKQTFNLTTIYSSPAVCWQITYSL